MDTIRSIILAMAYFIFATQSSPINFKHYTKRSSHFSERNPLDTLSALFFKLIPKHRTGAGQERTNASLPNCNTAGPSFTVEPAKPKLSNVSGGQFSNSFHKFSYFINVPVAHPFEKYKIIVVTAPPNIKLRTGDNEALVIYMVFNDNTSADDSRPLNMPEVYFVTQQKGGVNHSIKKKNDQIWIVNSNRTVTGLKSKDVMKFVNFTRKRRRSEANA